MWGSQGWNQWALQPSMFNNVPHDEIDWAELAKQWIQMQKPGSEGEGAPLLPSPAGPRPPPASMVPMEDYSRDRISPVTLGVDHQFSGRQELLNPPGVDPDSGSGFGPHNEGYWPSEWEGSGSGDIDERMWRPPPPPPPPVIMPPTEKKTFDYGHVHDNPPLAMQTVDYNHVSEHYYNQIYPPQEDPYDQYWSQVGSAATTAPMQMPPTFLKKDRVGNNNFQNEEDTSHIDAAKRKQLPAWIREGLEKMEQERLKRLEKERAEKEQVERAKKSDIEQPKKGLLGTGENESSSISMPSKSKFESESENEEDNELYGTSKVSQASTEEAKPHYSPPVEEALTEEEKQMQLMLKVRRLLTEILLSVTNSEMAAVAKEVHMKALARAPARTLATTPALRSIATGLNSLAGYESHSDVSESEAAEDDSSTSEDELRQRIQEKRRKFASKERKIMAEIEEAELKERERKRLQNLQDTRNSDSGSDHSRNKRSLSQPIKSESEVENQGDNNRVNQSSHNVFSAAVTGTQPNSSQSIPLISDGSLAPEYCTTNAENVNNKNDVTLNKNITAGENGDPRSSSKKTDSSTSTDSESDSLSSTSSSSPKSRSSKRHKTSGGDKDSKHDAKNKRRSRSKSPKQKRDKGRSGRRDVSGNSRGGNSGKMKKRRSRSKKRSKDKNHQRSDSSKSSHSSSSNPKKYHNSAEKSRHRSSSRDHHRRRKSHSRSRHRSPSASRYHQDSRSRSRSRKEAHSDRHKSSSNKYREDYHKSKRESKRSRSRSMTPKHYRRKSRSLSLDRSRHYKKSKMRSYDR